VNVEDLMKYFVIGPYPPPLGGVSVFVYRFIKQLKEHGHNASNVDFYKYSPVQKIIFLISILINPKEVTYHLNSIHYSILMALLLRIFPDHRVFYSHSGTGIKQQQGFRKWVFAKFLKSVDECIFVGDHIIQEYVAQGYKLPLNTRIQPAFIPPPLEEEEMIWKSYDEVVRKFIKNHSPILVANAYRITFLDNIDLYGLDMCVELTALLKKKFPNIGFLFALAEIGEKDYFTKINERIVELDISSNFLFLTGQKELWPIFRKARVMIRPTYKDGFGISLSEALYLGCTAIASDVCNRPEGTVLFGNRNLPELKEIVERYLNEQ
jgi:glycosyltransferase involved in cell wall biosynthesis